MTILADPSQPAMIPAGVPKLPEKFQTTEQISELTQLVLSTSAANLAMPRVGFWGMGGIDKTVTGAAVVRDDAVRLHFHAIVWLPLGQTPVMSKLQNLCHMQCTGKELSAELSGEEKKEALLAFTLLGGIGSGFPGMQDAVFTRRRADGGYGIPQAYTSATN